MFVARAKLLVGGALVIGAATYLAVAGIRSGWVYFVDVDRYVEAGPVVSQRTRLHGSVGSADSHPAELMARFTLVGATHEVPVLYRGPIPEMFQSGRQVVVEGAIDSSGVFQADLLLTKCASKYEGHGENGPPGAKVRG